MRIPPAPLELSTLDTFNLLRNKHVQDAREHARAARVTRYSQGLHTRLPRPDDVPIAATVELNSNNCFSHQGLKMRFAGVGHRPTTEGSAGAGGHRQDGGPGGAGAPQPGCSESRARGEVGVEAKLEPHPLVVCFDTGASDNFVPLSLARQLGLSLRPTPMRVVLGDSTVVTCLGEVTVRVCIQDLCLDIDFYVMNLSESSFNMILGDRFLRKYQGTLCYRKDRVKFHNLPTGKKVVLNVDPLLHPTATKPCEIISAKNLHKHVGPDDPVVALFFMADSPAVDPSPLQAKADLLASKFEHVPDAFRDSFKTLVTKFADVFPDDLPSGLPPDRNNFHAIPTYPDAVPPPKRQFRLGAKEKAELEAQCKDLWAKGYIQPSHSPYGAPILFVPKKDGTVRMCVDYRALNKQTIPNRFPMPRIDDILDNLAKAKVFSSIDLRQAYYQIRLKEEDVPKTAFTTHFGLFEYRVMPFGLANAPATFQNQINDTLRDLLNKSVIGYLDDILIYSNTWEEHLIHLEEVFSRIRQDKLYAKLSKCSFGQKRVKFLGHIVEDGAVFPDPDKVAIVQKWTPPRHPADLRSFLGLANYFRKFIQGYAMLTAPLNDLLKKKSTPWIWEAKQEAAFEGVKKSLCDLTQLKLPDLYAPFEVIADASLLGIGAVLCQDGRPISFIGRKLSPAEKNYHTGEQELLAVFYALTTWRCYLSSSEFKVVTDHHPNTFFDTKPILNRRLARWAEFIQTFQFTWEFRAGRLNVADPVSRAPQFEDAPAEHLDTFLNTCLLWKDMGPFPPPPGHVAAAEPLFSQVVAQHSLTHILGAMATRTSQAKAPAALRGSRLVPVSSPIGITKPIARTRGRPKAGTTPATKTLPRSPQVGYRPPPVPIRSPPSTQARVSDSPEATAVVPDEQVPSPFSRSTAAQECTPDLRSKLLKGYLHDSWFSDQKHLNQVQLKNGTYWKGSQLVIPDFENLRALVLHELHDARYSGHLGVKRTNDLVSRQYWWPTMAKDVNSYVRSCPLCQANKASTAKKAGLLQSLPIPDRYWDSISMDLITDLPVTSDGFDSILVVVDRLSKYAHFFPCKKKINAEGIGRILTDHIFKDHGIPLSIITDRDPRFTGKYLSGLLKTLGSKQNLSTAFHPQTDGQTERMNRVLEDMLRHYIDPRQKNWKDCLPMAEFACNNARSQSTGSTPFYLVFGQHPNTPIMGDLPRSEQARLTLEERKALAAKAKASIARAQDRQKQYADAHRSEVSFQTGVQVMLDTRNIKMKKGVTKKFFPKYLGPFTISEKIGHVAYKLELPPRWKIHPVFHVSLLKAYILPDESLAGKRLTKPLPVVLDDNDEPTFDVEAIMNHRPLSCKDIRKVSFFVRWSGYGREHDSWEPAVYLQGAQGAIADYWRTQHPLEVESILEHRFPDEHFGSRTIETAEYLVHWKNFGVGFDSYEPYRRLLKYQHLVDAYWRAPVLSAENLALSYVHTCSSAFASALFAIGTLDFEPVANTTEPYSLSTVIAKVPLPSVFGTVGFLGIY